VLLATRNTGAQWTQPGQRGGRILTDVFDLPLLRPKLLVEATSLGAAIAGGVGIGLYSGFDIAEDLVQVRSVEEPDPKRAQRYEELYQVFKQAYESLVNVYDRIAAL
jgi:xylulokinase